jgi:hypothetical protein
VRLATLSLDLLHLLFGQKVGESSGHSQLLDPAVVARRGDRRDALGPRPEKKDGRGVDILAGLLGQTFRDPLEDGTEGTSRLGLENGDQRTVGLGVNAVLLVKGEDGVDVIEDPRMVLELVDDGLDPSEGEELLNVLRPEVGHSERGGEFSRVDKSLEDLPELLELAFGVDERVVQEKKVWLSS